MVRRGDTLTRALDRSQSLLPDLDPVPFASATLTLRPGVVALRLAGELDGETAARLHDVLHSAVVGARAAVVDLTGVTRLGSTGVATLLGAYDRAGSRVHLCGLTAPAVRRVADLLGLDGHFTVHADIAGFLGAVAE